MGLLQKPIASIGLFMLLATMAAQTGVAQSLPLVQASFAHVVFGRWNPAVDDRWTTEFQFVNLGLSTASVTLRWYGDNGQQLYVTVVGRGAGPSHTYQIEPGNTTILRLDDTGVLTQGWASVEITGAVEGQGSYHWRVAGRPEYGAVLPLSRNSSQGSLILLGGGIPLSTVAAPRTMLVPFNNAGNLTGVAFANTSNLPRSLNLQYVSDNGTELMTQLVALGAGAHFSLALQDPRLAGQRGMIRVVGDSTPFSAIALSFVTEGETGPFTTLLPIVK